MYAASGCASVPGAAVEFRGWGLRQAVALEQLEVFPGGRLREEEREPVGGTKSRRARWCRWSRAGRAATQRRSEVRRGAGGCGRCRGRISGGRLQLQLLTSQRGPERATERDGNAAGCSAERDGGRWRPMAIDGRDRVRVKEKERERGDGREHDETRRGPPCLFLPRPAPVVAVHSIHALQSTPALHHPSACVPLTVSVWPRTRGSGAGRGSSGCERAEWW